MRKSTAQAGIRFIVIGLWAMTLGEVHAQRFETGANPGTVKTNSFWSDWFLQMDLDMSLQNPYGYDFADVFPNGKTFGADVAVGKWFTPQVGIRGKMNWENKLPLLENDHANWLAPFDEPGVNREKGGYIALYGDALLNLHNFFGAYRPDRKWNLSVYPRIGVNYNFGVSKGALLAGIGVLNTYRLSDRWSLMGDVAYVMCGSGFVGDNESGGTGTGSNSNGYFSIGIGAQYNLGRIHKEQPPHGSSGDSQHGKSPRVLTNGFWDNWFVQVGADMSLMNPYGCNFSKVIPKGQVFGINAAMGKWFTPEFALRARLQWENGLIENKSVEWVPPVEDPQQNYKDHGMAVVSIEAMLNLTNIISGYDPNRKWHTSGYVRAGIISQFVTGSGSPLAGIGIEGTYRLSDRLSCFGSAGYQVSTSEGMGVSTTGMEVSAGSNGFFDIGLGVKVDLGINRFYQDAESQSKAYSQAVKGHNWSRFAVNTLASVGMAYMGKSALKAVVKEERPDHSDDNSFPSGHAAMAFAAARSIDKEFRSNSIWIPIAGYAVATAIGVERVISDRHHWYDVVAGAGLGIAATELTWWLTSMITKQEKFAVGVSGNSIDVAVKLNNP